MKRWLAAVVISASTAMVETAHGDEPYTLAHGYSPYEEATLRAALTQVGRSIDPAPEGKTLEGIDIVTLDPIEPRDPAPLFFNAVHVTTRRDVIEREVLLGPGDPYRQALVDETARNLRSIPQQSLVLCVATFAGAPDRVRLLVVTKDVWSLFVDFDLALTGGGLELLELKPRESNVAGTQNTALARLVLQPRSFSLGLGYVVPRLEGRRLALSIDTNVIFERPSGRIEGSYGSVLLTRPLFSARTEWAGLIGVTWRDEVYRRYSNAHVATCVYLSGSACVFDAFATPGYRVIPWEYRSRSFVQTAAVTRSFGWATKNDFTLGAEVNRREYTVRDPVAYDPRAVAAFRDQIPIGEVRVGPFVTWHGYTTDFLRILDLETLGLQEDVSLGHDLVLRIYPVARALGATRTFFGVHAAAQYTVPLGDGLARASIASTTESEVDQLTDASVTASLRTVTPRLGFGRLVFDSTLVNRYRDHLNVRSFLGGEGRLRGFPTRYLNGKDVVVLNLEYRSRPIELASLQMGLGVFYDVGDAFDGLAHLRPKHSIGAGLRIVFPQIDRSVLRFDMGFPMPFGTRPDDVSPFSFFIGFDQAFQLPGVAPDLTSATPTIGSALGD